MRKRKKTSPFANDLERALFAARMAIDTWALAVRDAEVFDTLREGAGDSWQASALAGSLHHTAIEVLFRRADTVLLLKMAAKKICDVSARISQDASPRCGGMIRGLAEDDVVPRVEEAILALNEAEKASSSGGGKSIH